MFLQRYGVDTTVGTLWRSKSLDCRNAADMSKEEMRQVQAAQRRNAALMVVPSAPPA